MAAYLVLALGVGMSWLNCWLTPSGVWLPALVERPNAVLQGRAEFDGRLLSVSAPDIDLVMADALGVEHRFRGTSEFVESPDGRLRVFEYVGRADGD